MTKHFPACYVLFPKEARRRRAPFYLAAEEYIAQTFAEGDYLFSWQLAPTVVMGRNQVAHQEIDLDFCRREGIDIVRRKSGGGAIFADRGNVMWSLITGEASVETLFAEYASEVARALCKLGAPAEVSGRNDITLRGGGKVCGNAFYHLPHRNIVHGTMLYDTNSRLMQGALHPDKAKFEAKGVKSVRSRIALLKDYIPSGVDALREKLRPLLTDQEVLLSEKDIFQIEQLEQSYYAPAYLYGQATASDITRSARIEGCGKVELHITLRGSLISDIALRGDYFETADAQTAFRQALIGATLTLESLKEVLARQHPERTIRGLTSERLLKLLFS